jgi:hypothetical protein
MLLVQYKSSVCFVNTELLFYRCLTSVLGYSQATAQGITPAARIVYTESSQKSSPVPGKEMEIKYICET